MSPDTTMLAVVDRATESMFCNRLNVNEGLTDLMRVADVYPVLLPTFRTGVNNSGAVRRVILAVRRE